MRTLILTLAPSIGLAAMLVFGKRARQAPVPVPVRVERRGRR